MGTNKFSDLQLELLKVYSFNPTKEDLIQIKKMLATFFAGKLTGNIQNAVKHHKITDEHLENWLNKKS